MYVEGQKWRYSWMLWNANNFIKLCCIYKNIIELSHYSRTKGESHLGRHLRPCHMSSCTVIIHKIHVITFVWADTRDLVTWQITLRWTLFPTFPSVVSIYTGLAAVHSSGSGCTFWSDNKWIIVLPFFPRKNVFHIDVSS